KEVFTLKELEKIAPKEKGITLQILKEVVQSLVDDSLVDSEQNQLFHLLLVISDQRFHQTKCENRRVAEENRRDKREDKRGRAMKSHLDLAKQGTDRWTDNVLSVISWCKKKFPNFEEKAFKQQYEIDEDFDCVE
ncbi:Meiotic nuclear division protein 1-like protein, partial [Dinothrombium tinctorium]